MPEGMDIDCSFHPQHVSPEAFTEKVIALSEKFVMKPRITLTDYNREEVNRIVAMLPNTERIQPRVIYDYASTKTAGDLVTYHSLYERDGVEETKDVAVRDRDFHGMFCNTNNSTLIVSPDRSVTSCIYEKQGASSIHDFDFTKLNAFRPPKLCDSFKCDPCNLKDAKFKNILDCVHYAQENFI